VPVSFVPSLASTGAVGLKPTEFTRHAHRCRYACTHEAHTHTRSTHARTKPQHASSPACALPLSWPRPTSSPLCARPCTSTGHTMMSKCRTLQAIKRVHIRQYMRSSLQGLQELSRLGNASVEAYMARSSLHGLQGLSRLGNASVEACKAPAPPRRTRCLVSGPRGRAGVCRAPCPRRPRSSAAPGRTPPAGAAPAGGAGRALGLCVQQLGWRPPNTHGLPTRPARSASSGGRCKC